MTPKFWKRFSSDVTSLELPSGISPTVTHSRFEEDWKEFDKLNDAVNGRGPIRWVRSVFEVALTGGAAISLKFWHQNREIVVLLWAVSVGLGLAYMYVMRSRFAHWQCPRCHAEWPGTKKEKDARCRVCGLRLHELA